MLIQEFASRENTMSRKLTNKLAKDALAEVLEGPGKESRALVVHSDSRERAIADYVYWVKAPPVKKWTMTCKVIADEKPRTNSLSFLNEM